MGDKGEVDENNQQLRRACHQGNIEEVKELLKLTNIDINQYGSGSFMGNYSPLMLVCTFVPNIEILNLLLSDRRIDVNSVDIEERNSTPFLRSCSNQNTKIMKVLLNDPRVNVNIADTDGKTPLMIALENESTLLTELILSSPKLNIQENILDFAQGPHETLIQKYLKHPNRVASELRKKYGLCYGEFFNNSFPFILFCLRLQFS